MSNRPAQAAGLIPSQLPGQRHELPGRYWYLAITRPTDLLGRAYSPLRAALISISNQAFGTDTAPTWKQRFKGEFFTRLDRFYLVFAPDHALIGWSGHRARTICDEQIVYFDSTGLLPAHQGRRLIASLQRAALELEQAAGEPRPTGLVVRTRNPAAYRLAIKTHRTEPVIPLLDGTVPKARRRLVAETARWLDQHPFDPATGRVIGAYSNRPPLYGPRRCAQVGDPAIDRLFASLANTDALLLFARNTTGQSHKAGREPTTYLTSATS